MDILIDNEEVKAVRFACSCLHPSCVLDVTLLRFSGGKEISLSFAEGIQARGRWWNRLKAAVFCLLGRKIFFAEVIIRKGDVPHLLDLIGEAMTSKYTATSGTSILIK